MNASDKDKTIGENLRAWRGNMSQKDVALAMKNLGHKWSQATVWSIEKGERPLRLAEAQDLVTVFGRYIDFLSPKRKTVIDLAITRVHEKREELLDEMVNYLEVRAKLASTVASTRLEGEDFSRRALVSYGGPHGTLMEVARDALAKWAGTLGDENGLEEEERDNLLKIAAEEERAVSAMYPEAYSNRAFRELHDEHHPPRDK